MQDIGDEAHGRRSMAAMAGCLFGRSDLSRALGGVALAAAGTSGTPRDTRRGRREDLRGDGIVLARLVSDEMEVRGTLGCSGAPAYVHTG